MVICGFPRSGTTLMMWLLAGTVKNYKVDTQRENKHPNAEIQNREEFIIKGPHMVTRFPRRPVIMVRDPRAVVTSRLNVNNTPDHQKYFFGIRDNRHGSNGSLINLFNNIKRYNDALLVRYEDLVSSPDDMQDRVGNFWGLEYNDLKFSDYPNGWEKFDEGWGGMSQWAGKLNGIRPIDSGHDWKDHLPRLREQGNIDKFQEILEYFGYEKDDSWQSIL